MRKLKLSHRIFMSMLVLIFFSFLAVGITTIFRYQTKNKEYHKERLKREKTGLLLSQLSICSTLKKINKRPIFKFPVAEKVVRYS